MSSDKGNTPDTEQGSGEWQGSRDAGDGEEEEVAEGWEEELDEALMPNAKVHDWDALQSQIKQDLKKHKFLPLSQINQLMIFCNSLPEGAFTDRSKL